MQQLFRHSFEHLGRFHSAVPTDKDDDADSVWHDSPRGNLPLVAMSTRIVDTQAPLRALRVSGAQGSHVRPPRAMNGP